MGPAWFLLLSFSSLLACSACVLSCPLCSRLPLLPLCCLGLGFWTMVKRVQPPPLPPPLQLGILIQWQQALNARYWALEGALRRDLLRMGFDVLQLPPAALLQLDRLAHMGGFTGAVYSGSVDSLGVWAHSCAPSRRSRPVLPPCISTAVFYRSGASLPLRPIVGSSAGCAPFSLWGHRVDHTSSPTSCSPCSAHDAPTLFFPSVVGICADGRRCVRPAGPGSWSLLPRRRPP